MESNENACVHHCNLISNIWNKQMKEFKNKILVNSPSCIILICNLTCILCSLLYVLASQTTNVLCDECLGWWMSEVVNVWGGECLRWWTSGVVNVWGGERLILHWGWWTSGVVNVWGGERLRWWTSEVVNVWGGERLILHWGWWASGVVNVWFYTWGGERLGWWMSGWWTSYNLCDLSKLGRFRIQRSGLRPLLIVEFALGKVKDIDHKPYLRMRIGETSG